MRNGMLATVILLLPVAWALQGLGNHGLWISFLLFMVLRSLTLGAQAWFLKRNDGWFNGTEEHEQHLAHVTRFAGRHPPHLAQKR